MKIRKDSIILIAVSVIFFLIYLSLCFNDNIWTDEAFTIELIKNSFEGIIDGTASDVHPPLYYIILKPFTMVFGEKLIVMKLVSIIPMMITMVTGGFYLQKSYGFKEGLLFKLILGAVPCTMEYAVQIRMYSWAMLFVTLMSVLAFEYYKRGGKILTVALGVVAAACAYTHYFAFAAALWIYGILFLAIIIRKRQRILSFIAAAAISLAIFYPWMHPMKIQIQGVSRNYWIEEITEKTWKGFMPFLFGMDIPWSDAMWGIVLIGALGLLAYRIASSDQKGMKWYFALFLFLVPILTLLAGVEISALLRPIFIIRYLLPCMGLLSMSLAIILGSVGDMSVYAALVAFCICSVGVDHGVSVYREYEWTQTDETKAFLAENVGKDDIIAFNYEDYYFVYDYYWGEDEKIPWSEVDLESDEWENIWLLDTIYMPYPTDEYLERMGWAREYRGNFGIEHNSFKIWRLHRK